MEIGMNCDQQVDVRNIVSVASCWDRPIDSSCPAYRDMDGDNDIDVADVLQAAGAWSSLPGPDHAEIRAEPASGGQ